MGTTVYQLKASILDIRPPVWRRVVVPADITLSGLHVVLQAAFGWWDYHLHEFEINGERYGIDDGEGWQPPKDERHVRLSAVTQDGSSFMYIYDFGDYWRHKIEVEKVLSAEPGTRLPACVGGRRACPPEDCGGTWGYEGLLEAIQDPKHEEHEGCSSGWVGSSTPKHSTRPTSDTASILDSSKCCSRATATVMPG